VWYLPIDTKKLIAIQERLKHRLSLHPKINKINYICGLDAAYVNDFGIGVAVVLSYPELELLEYKYITQRITIPYIPTFLCFRELPILIGAFKKLEHNVDVVFVDSHGIAHPRGFGCASHIGVLLDLPTIGVSKKLLFGVSDKEPKKVGEWTYLKHPNENRPIGAIVKTSKIARPIYVSPGHKIDILTAVKLTIEVSKQKLPEPIKIADAISKKLRKKVITSY